MGGVTGNKNIVEPPIVGPMKKGQPLLPKISTSHSDSTFGIFEIERRAASLSPRDKRILGLDQWVSHPNLSLVESSYLLLKLQSKAADLLLFVCIES